ncbi:MAG: hypothetical protein AAGB26_06270 [Planctomycetota bacterium]
MGNVSGRSLLRLANLAASDTAYFAARARLPIDVLGRLVLEVLGRAESCRCGVGLWHGHRVLMIDGSGVSMPDAPDRIRGEVHLIDPSLAVLFNPSSFGEDEVVFAGGGAEGFAELGGGEGGWAEGVGGVVVAVGAEVA